MNSEQNHKISIKEIAVFGMLGALLFASKIAMEALPNIHLLATLVISITVVYRKKALSIGGILGAVLLDICVSVAFGNFGFALLVTFLACGVLADRVKSRIKGKRSEKHECRDLLQVFSNGFAAMLAAALQDRLHQPYRASLIDGYEAVRLIEEIYQSSKL